jgi:hypothetical protein
MQGSGKLEHRRKNMSVLNKTLSAGLAAVALLAGNPVTAMTENQAEIEAYCRQEAADYGIQPEQVAEYIEGCVLAMGGSTYAVPEDAVPDDPVPADAVPEDLLPDAEPELTEEPVDREGE